jgi:hypothetical protein
MGNLQTICYQKNVSKKITQRKHKRPMRIRRKRLKPIYVKLRKNIHRTKHK